MMAIHLTTMAVQVIAYKFSEDFIAIILEFILTKVFPQFQTVIIQGQYL